MKSFKKFAAIFICSMFVFGCATITTTVTPAVVQAAGYDIGYYGWAFTTMAPVSQLAINAACSLASSGAAVTDPSGTLTNLLNLFQQDWTAAYNVMINSKYGALVQGAAQLVINEINNIVGQLNSASSSAQVAQYIMAAVTGICAGVRAAQGQTTAFLSDRVQINVPWYDALGYWAEQWWAKWGFHRG